VIVKPASGDNSLGMSLVKEATDYDAALKRAFEHADEVMVEAFIAPGREVRCSIIVKDGQLIALPLEEYLVDPHERPIRTYTEKFPELDAKGKFLGWPEDDIRNHWITDSNDPLTEKVQQVAKKCHTALGCRHYSLFDFRVDPNGEPWFLEAGLYCSFGNGSGIPHTAKAAGISLDELLMTMIKETLSMV
jgi:D-alanine-D-alanine ligase